MITLKMVTLGLSGVGKSTAILTYGGAPPGEYVPTVVDPFDVLRVFDGTPVRMTMWEMPGHEEYARFRAAAWQDASAVLLFFSVSSMESIRTIREDLIIDLNKIIPGVPIVLVASKIDLREDQKTIDDMKEAYGRSPISTEEGLNLAQEFNAAHYMEACGQKDQGVNEMFEVAAKAALSKLERNDKKKCIVM